MKTRLTHFCLIYNFLDIGFNSGEISNRVKMYVDEILEINSFYYPSDWVLTFNANYNNRKYLLITKNKFGSYKSDKDYIVDCLQRGIFKVFQEGFTVGGIKLKTNNFH